MLKQKARLLIRFNRIGSNLERDEIRFALPLSKSLLIPAKRESVAEKLGKELDPRFRGDDYQRLTPISVLPT
jgi:hypothetical protein